MKRILLLLGHPFASGVCGALADAYEEGARGAGYSVERFNLGEMTFDPILRKGYRERQLLEYDLEKCAKAIAKCDHLVVVFPLWWSGMPALLKGFFDRLWLPGSAFRYIKTKTGERTLFWERLFRGKTAHILVSCGSPAWMVRFLPGTGVAQLRWGILWFAGFSVRSTWFGSSEMANDSVKERWIQKVRRMGQCGH